MFTRYTKQQLKNKTVFNTIYDALTKQNNILLATNNKLNIFFYKTIARDVALAPRVYTYDANGKTYFNIEYFGQYSEKATKSNLQNIIKNFTQDNITIIDIDSYSRLCNKYYDQERETRQQQINNIISEV